MVVYLTFSRDYRRVGCWLPSSTFVGCEDRQPAAGENLIYQVSFSGPIRCRARCKLGQNFSAEGTSRPIGERAIACMDSQKAVRQFCCSGPTTSREFRRRVAFRLHSSNA